MEFMQTVHTIVAVAVIVLLDVAAVVKAVSVIVQRVKATQQEAQEHAAAEEQAIKKVGLTKILRQIVFGLVADAEKELGAGTGKLKSAKVAGWLYDKIPDELKTVFSAEDIQDMIDSVLREAQEYWNKNAKAREYIESGAAPQQPVQEAAEALFSALSDA